jgi:hypothetical protein
MWLPWGWAATRGRPYTSTLLEQIAPLPVSVACC